MQSRFKITIFSWILFLISLNFVFCQKKFFNYIIEPSTDIQHYMIENYGSVFLFEKMETSLLTAFTSCQVNIFFIIYLLFFIIWVYFHKVSIFSDSWCKISYSNDIDKYDSISTYSLRNRQEKV